MEVKISRKYSSNSLTKVLRDSPPFSTEHFLLFRSLTKKIGVDFKQQCMIKLPAKFSPLI